MHTGERLTGTEQTRIATATERMERISRPVSSADTRISGTTAIPITSNPMATGNGGSFNRAIRIIAKGPPTSGGCWLESPNAALQSNSPRAERAPLGNAKAEKVVPRNVCFGPKRTSTEKRRGNALWSGPQSNGAKAAEDV